MYLFFSSFRKQNLLLSGLFGLPVLLGASQTLVKGFSIGLVIALTVFILAMLVRFIQPFITASTRFVVYTVLSASLIALIELFLQAFFYELYLQLGIYIPIIAMSCLLFWMLDEKAVKLPVASLFKELIYFTIGCVFIFSLMGAIRELFSEGSLFKQSELLHLPQLSVKLHSLEFSLFSILPGALFILGFLIAFRNSIFPMNDN